MPAASLRQVWFVTTCSSALRIGSSTSGVEPLVHRIGLTTALPMLTCALLAGCGSSEPTPADVPAATASVTAPAEDRPDILTDVEVSAEDRASYLAGLRDIDPGLTSNEDRAIRRVTNICLDVEQGKDETTIINNTVERLSGGSATINETQAAEVVELARTHICR